MTKSSAIELNRALQEIINLIISEPNYDASKLENYKRKIARKYNLNRFLRNSEILAFIDNNKELTYQKKDCLKELLRVRKVRTISGIAVVAVMTKPAPCPGECIYCPDVSGSPKSYTGREPAAMRGIQNEFHPKKQVKARLKQLESIGHDLDKVHLVVMGGTFLSNPRDYQNYFIKQCLDGITGTNSADLTTAKLNSERGSKRNVGITIETRPDYCKSTHVDRILELGGTWVEIGIQSLSDEVLSFVQRHHDTNDIEEAIRFARDGGLKVTVHMMPNLFQTPSQDIEMFEMLYSNPRFVPDALKIYPTLVLKNTRLFELWKKKEYVPYTSDEVVDVISEIKSITPPFVRIQRVQRDIPAYLITDGIRYGNLRELAEDLLHKKGKRCSCIRCREVGHQSNKGDISWKEKEKKVKIQTYNASSGTEHFISYETTDSQTLFGFLRLREPSEYTFRKEIHESNSTIIRELHVYGRLVSLGKPPEESEWQHRGLGQQLIQRAEELSLSKGFSKIFVTSGLGVKDYYQKLGFQPEGPYMGKQLKI